MAESTALLVDAPALLHVFTRAAMCSANTGIDRTSVMAGVLGGATALAGLLVVFLGFLTTAYASLAGAAHSVKAPYRRAINGALAMVVLTLTVALLALVTMLVTTEIQSIFFWVTIAGFIAMLVLLAALAIIATRLTT